MEKPNEFIEVFLSMLKWFLIVLLLNDAIIIGGFVIATSSEEAVTTLTQDGEGNIQGINNGTIN